MGDNLFGRFLEIEIGTTLAVVIDDTTSMTGEIEAAKQRVNVRKNESYIVVFPHKSSFWM